MSFSRETEGKRHKMYFINNRQKLMNSMKNNSVLVVFSDDGNKIDHNFYYLTQIKQANSAYVIVKENHHIEEYLFIPALDEFKIRWEGFMMSVEEVKQQSHIEQVVYCDNLDRRINYLLSSYEVENIYLNLNPELYNVHNKSNEWVETIRKRYPHLVIYNCFHNIANMRVIKSPEEINKMKRAMEITKEGIEKLMTGAKVGMYEYQLKAIFEYELGMQGVQVPGFDTNVSCGGHEFCMHYNELTGKISEGDLILIDLGAQIDGYCVDISRVFPVSGKFSEKQRLIYEVSLAANKKVMQIIKPGITFADVENTCRKEIYYGLKKLGLVNEYEDVSKYFWHGVAHYVGLDVHDVGTYHQLVCENMVFTVDAGIYVPEWNVGLRIEDNILVTATGCEHLSKDIPREIEEIEALLSCKE